MPAIQTNAYVLRGAYLFSIKSTIAHMIVNTSIRVYARLTDDIEVCEVYYIGSWWTVYTAYVLFDLTDTA